MKHNVYYIITTGSRIVTHKLCVSLINLAVHTFLRFLKHC